MKLNFNFKKLHINEDYIAFSIEIKPKFIEGGSNSIQFNFIDPEWWLTKILADKKPKAKIQRKTKDMYMNLNIVI